MALGIVLLFPMMLAAGPLIGYGLAHFVIVQKFHGPQSWEWAGIALGFFASGLQVYRWIKQLKEMDSKD
ncbi:MAG: hypothetical protein ACOY3K_04410 [Candidatus Omnitrophota bacterium]